MDSKHRWAYPAGGFLVGLVGLILTRQWQWLLARDLTKYVTEHISVALVVAALVGFGYEFQAYERKIVALIAELLAIRSREALSQYPVVIKAVFDPENKIYKKQHERLSEHCSALIAAIVTIEQKKIAAYSVSIDMVIKLLEYASKAASAIAKARQGGEHHLRLPLSAASLVDEILADHMSATIKNDSYLVISDFSSWHPQQLRKFSAASEEAMRKRRIRIKRVFRQYAADAKLSPADAELIIAEHWKLAGSIGLHRGLPLYDVALSLDTTSGHPHLGVFRFRGRVIRFAPVEGSQLSDIYFSLSEETEDFDKCWTKALPAFQSDSMTGVLEFVDWETAKQGIPRIWWDGFKGAESEKR